jgi:UDP-N-acetylglucosamine--N-acetylmuramyl-(pentapeptide) pyrophosphoryl-undecaprenol N-acetylglucosamine transferase
VIFVPFPFAAEDHQTVNAQHLVEKHAGIMIKDSEAKEKLVPAVIALSKNEGQQRELQQNIGKLAVTDADTQIASSILKAIK